MRTIKFRAYSNVYKEWAYLTFEMDGALIVTTKENDWTPHSWQQFTGLLDKNGKKIYEGDIVEIKHPFRARQWKGEIVWGEYGFWGKDFFFSHFDIPNDLFCEGTEYIEVIGNIYENKDLLK